MQRMKNLLPTLFVSHGGGPAHALDYSGSAFGRIDRNSPSAAFIRALPQRLEEFCPLSSIKAILVISAHWEESEFTVDYQTDKTKLIYDYFGFDKTAYAPYLTYPAPTDISVANRVYELLQENEIPVTKKNRGWDHGTFMPLLVAFPEGKIPIVQLSLKFGLHPADHFRVGEALRPLRNEGVLIIGSGQITHNLGALDRDGISNHSDSRTDTFLEYIFQLFKGIRTDADYLRVKELFCRETNKIPHFDFHHPRTEHFIPILVALAAGIRPSSALESQSIEDSSQPSATSVVETHRLYTEVVLGTMGLDSYLFQ